MKWIAITCLGFTIVTTGWSDVGPDVLRSLSNGDSEAMRLIDDRVSLAAQEGNRVAQGIAHEAKIAMGQDQIINHFSMYNVPPTELYEDTEKDWLTAVMKKAADGDPFFMDVMGYLCFNGYANVPKDQHKAVTWWGKAAELKGGMAQFRLGNCYVNGDGEGVPRDLQKAAAYFRGAGESGISAGWYGLGCLYNGWEGWAPRNLKKAMECWAKSAPLGHAWSQFNLGHYYCNGDDGFPVNKKLGIQWMRAAASNGNPRAKAYLADYVEKTPVPRTLPAVIEDRSTDVVSTFIAFEKIDENMAGSKVSVVCFVDSYAPRTSDPFKGDDTTPSKVLDTYLGGLRTLKRQPTEPTSAATVSSDNVKIFIVECQGDTRAKAREFNRRYRLTSYDGTIPVVCVFKSGQWIRTYTYESDPGPNGTELKSLVESLMSKDPAWSGTK